MSVVDWRYFLGVSPPPGTDPTLPLERIAWLRKAADRTLNVAMNRAGELGFRYPALEKKWSRYLFDPTLCIIAERDGEEVWSGPLANNAGQAQSTISGDMTIKAVGWFDLCGLRELREDVFYSATNNYSHLSGAVPGQGTTLPAGHTAAEGVAWTDAEIIFDLINKINGYDPAHALPLVPGIAVGTRYTRQVSWTKGTKLSDCLRLLMDVEAGVDIRVDSQRRVNVYSWDSYADHANIVWGFNKPPFNCESFSWTSDMMAIRNRMPITGFNGASALAEDTGSQNLVGLREESVNLPDVSEPANLLYYGGAEIALKAQAHVFYSFTPKTTKASSHKLFENFIPGEGMRFSVDYGPFQEDQLTVRAFTANVSISNEGEEKITQLTTMANQS